MRTQTLCSRRRSSLHLLTVSPSYSGACSNGVPMNSEIPTWGSRRVWNKLYTLFANSQARLLTMTHVRLGILKTKKLHSDLCTQTKVWQEEGCWKLRVTKDACRNSRIVYNKKTGTRNANCEQQWFE
ncbi:hypothetical protein NLU13_0398 [Sarocladium strictum]|uniref:Uncharacterized protein n=1 Tax=Sarocladium strictum TaxID=5046 RepID=A0AA39GNZ2_SARSR|nr:hypothetical protein NLU13_0398 [Sarocladium strictum]